MPNNRAANRNNVRNSECGNCVPRPLEARASMFWMRRLYRVLSGGLEHGRLLLRVAGSALGLLLLASRQSTFATGL